MKQQLIDTLSQLRGIESNYIDAWGNPATVDPTSKEEMLAAMGYSVNDETKLAEEVEQEIVKQWTQPLPAVVVTRQAAAIEFEIRLPITLANEELTWTVTPEEGKPLKGKFKAVDGELVGSQVIEQVEYQAYKIKLDQPLPLGYHRISIKQGRKKAMVDSRFIIAPQACYKPDEIIHGKKVWGPSVQLYCLKSKRNWGIGDFTDLSYLVGEIAKHGGDFVGLNPIHALYPSNPESASPYSPSSRRWLNIVYIDVQGIEDYADSEEAKALVTGSDFEWRLGELRGKPAVDYTGVTEAKLQALRLVFNTFQQTQLAKNTKRAKAFKAFVEAGGESLREQALYDAIQFNLYAKGENAWGWPAWDEAINEYHKPGVAKYAEEHADDLQFFEYLQWVADSQLAAVQKKAEDLGMTLGLYRDLAVGVSEGSNEIWANSSLYCTDASVGAPPDILGPLGQNWGLPPMDPAKLIEQEYQPMIDLFRSNMRSSGALRIDHVMALLRLWWIPKGESADKGAYVYYNIDDMLGLLALESHRNHCLVIGEDLGTVPEGIDETLKTNGVHSYRVFFFEQAEDGGFISPQHYPEQAMATLTTHDMPTLIGFWHCDDLKLGKELGLYRDEEVLQTLYNDRHESKQKILDTLHGHQSIPDYLSRDVNWVGMTKDLNFGMQLHMAKGSTALLSLQLEDWLEMDKPVNVPGTSDEYPNWRRKLSRDLDELFNDSDIIDLQKRLTQARSEASKG